MKMPSGAPFGDSDRAPGLQGGAGVNVEDGLVKLIVRPPGAEMPVWLHPEDAEALGRILIYEAKKVSGEIGVSG